MSSSSCNSKKKKHRNVGSEPGQKALQDAMTALESARSEIESLRLAKEKAAEDVRRASDAVNQSGGKSTEDAAIHSYGEERYWEERYKKDMSYLNERNNLKSPSSELYEWYLPYSELKQLIEPELDRIGRRDTKILVPGCGNSSLCEDLARAGCDQVVGMDYSQTVVSAMQHRCNNSDALRNKIRYVSGDARDMRGSELDQVYDFAIDKGTLDAIISDTSNNSMGVNSAIRYLQELWRVLKCSPRSSSRDGRLLLLSTMPPPVLAQLFQSCPGGKSMWNLSAANMAILKTTEMRDIFYYSFPCEPTYKYYSFPFIGQSGLESGMTSAAGTEVDILSKISSIRKEAEDAISSLKNAQVQMEQSLKQKLDLENSLKASEDRVKDLECSMESAWSNVSSGVLSDNTENASHSDLVPLKQTPTTSTTPVRDSIKAKVSSLNWRDETITQRIASRPKSVELKFVLSPSAYQSSPHVGWDVPLSERRASVSYRLQSEDSHFNPADNIFDAWDEDDTIDLEAVYCRTSAGVCETVPIYHESDLQPYESFEYTESPSVISPLIGSEYRLAEGVIDFPLPSCGGWFVFSYIRHVVLMETENGAIVHSADDANGKVTVTRQRVQLARSEPFQLSFNVFQCHPSELLPADRSVRRRGAGPLTSVDMLNTSHWETLFVSQSKVENTTSSGNKVIYRTPYIEVDDRSVKSLSISLSARSEQAKSIVILSRVLAWCNPSKTHSCIVVEADVITIDSWELEYIEKQTRYWIFDISCGDDSMGSYSLILKRGIGSVTIGSNYISLLFSIEATDKCADGVLSVETIDKSSIQCSFCNEVLISDLKASHANPEGITHQESSDQGCAPLSCLFVKPSSSRCNLVTFDGTQLSIYENGAATVYPITAHLTLPSTMIKGDLSYSDKHRVFYCINCVRCGNVIGDLATPLDSTPVVYLPGHLITFNRIDDITRPVKKCNRNVATVISKALRKIYSDVLASSSPSNVPATRLKICVGDPEFHLFMTLELINPFYLVCLTTADVTSIDAGRMKTDKSNASGQFEASYLRCVKVRSIYIDDRDWDVHDHQASCEAYAFIQYSEFMQLKRCLSVASLYVPEYDQTPWVPSVHDAVSDGCVSFLLC